MRITCIHGARKPTPRQFFCTPQGPEQVLIDSNVLKNGVMYVDWDGSMPGVTLGYMCVKGWNDPRL